MTSCAPRLKTDKAPSWTSVSIHWTDSDMSSFEKVDGLPWIRKTDHAKMFNKNGPLRVVASYRSTDGVEPDGQYRHVSIIADAIEQYVLVKVTMPEEISPKPSSNWPKFRIWAFLQPPIIGRDKKRRDANGGYVVDDIPRAGWFEAVVDGKTMTGEEIDYSKGHKSPAGKKSIKVTGERDATDPKIVHFKICVRVANNESEADLKAKSQKLRKKHQDVSLVEAGSYMKIWVRNEERSWSVNPLDDDSEKIVQSMADSDRIKSTKNGDPRKFRNHTWKRSRLASHKSISGTDKNPDKNLLYVGLYPAHVIEKIEKFEAKIAQVDEHKGHPLAWITTVIAWTLLAQGAKALRTKVASNRTGKNAVGDESPHMKTTKQIAELFKSAQLSELFASYAVAGYDTFTDVMGTVERAQVHHDQWYNRTKSLMEMILKASLLSDAKSRDHHAMQKLLEDIEKELNPPKKKTFKDSISKEMLGWGRSWKDNSFTATVKLLEEKTDKTIPETPSPLPLPFLEWLSWYVKLAAEADLKLKFAVSCSKENELELTAGIEGGGKASAKIGLQGIWARVGDAASEKVGKEMPGPEGELLQKIVQLVNLELSLKAEISPQASAEIGAKFVASGNREDTWKVKLSGNFNCPLEFNLSVFSWSYDTFNGKVWDLTKSQGAFFKDVVAFGHPQPKWATVIPWGESKYSEKIFTLTGGQNHGLAAAFGAIIPLYLPYSSAVDPEKCTASIQLVSDVPVDLASKIVVTNQVSSKQDGSGEVYAPVRFTWNPAPNKSAGVVSLFAMYPSKWDKLKTAFSALSSKERSLLPIITTPDDDEKELSANSSISLLSPKARPARFQAVTHVPKGLLFEYDLDFYMDSHVWVKLCEDDLFLDDVCTLRGHGKSDWRLYPLQGSADLHSRRSIFIPISDIQSIGNKETAYQFYLKLALLDDDDCEIKNESSMRLTVPDPTYRMLQAP